MKRSNWTACACGLVLALGATACGGSQTSAASNGQTSGGEQSGTAGVPSGYHSITPHLVVTDVDGALAFYERAFGATPTSRIATPDGTVVHAEMRIGDSIVMLGPEQADHGQRAPASVNGTNGALFVYVEDVDAATARAVSAGATQLAAPTDMFWGDRYAQVRDPQGHRWQLATHRIYLTPTQIRERAEAFLAATASGSEPPGFEGGTPATSYRPSGYFDVTPVLVVDSPEAIDFYVRALGAIERMRSLMPDGRLMHAEIQLGNSVVMLGNEMPESPTDADIRTPAHLGAATLTLVHYNADADAAAERAVEAGATSAMPVAEMFWGDRYGVVVDPSGHPWAMATHVRDVTPEEMQAALGHVASGEQAQQ
jgi:PhnB protein